jgi:hypothetical protein
MDTEITNRFFLAAEAWDDYDAVYLLTQTSPAAFSFGGTQLVGPGASQPNQTAAPGRQANPGQGQTPGTTLLYTGEYFSLEKIEIQPELSRGVGDPALEGNIEEIGTDQLVVDGEIVQFTQDTIFSLGARQITSDRIEAGRRVLVWGEWQGIFNRLLEASYITVVLPGQPNSNQQPNIPLQTNPETPPAQSEGSIIETVQLGRLTMVTRAGWGAREMNLNARAETGWFNPETNPTGVLRYQQPLADWLTTVVVHHSALPVERGPAEIQALHMDKAGYADIGYHFVIAIDGTLFEGRPIQLRGAHTEGFNTGTVGVVLLGNFENTEPTQEQLQTLNQLVIYLRNRYGITHLAGHRDFNPDLTVCPGENLAGLLADIANQTDLVFGTGGYQPPPWDTP